MNAHELLIAARALVAKGWCQRALWRDAAGNKFPHARQPVCWCAYGALVDVHRGSRGPRVLDDATDALVVAAPVPLLGNMGEWNDAPERTVEDVLAAYDRAIAATAGDA